MKYLFLVLMLVLTACGDNPKKEKIQGPLDDVSGFYIGQGGTLNNVEITGIHIKDNWFNINVHWVLSTLEVVKCKYQFFERLDDIVYFVTIPDEYHLINTLSFSLKENGLLQVKSLGDEQNGICSSFKLNNNYTESVVDEENRVQIVVIE